MTLFPTPETAAGRGSAGASAITAEAMRTAAARAIDAARPPRVITVTKISPEATRLHAKFGCLTQRERQIVNLAFGVWQQPPLSLDKIAKGVFFRDGQETTVQAIEDQLTVALWKLLLAHGVTRDDIEGANRSCQDAALSDVFGEVWDDSKGTKALLLRIEVTPATLPRNGANVDVAIDCYQIKGKVAHPNDPMLAPYFTVTGPTIFSLPDAIGSPVILVDGSPLHGVTAIHINLGERE